MSKQPLIDYINLIHKNSGDVEAPDVKKFYSTHSEDKLFRKRAAVIHYLFRLKCRILTEKGEQK